MFDLFGINFHWYGLLIGLGIWLGMEIALNRPHKIEKKLVNKLMWWAVIGGILGARLYHVIDYWNRYYSTNLLRVFYFWEGGLGIWGALLGGLISIAIFCYFNKLKIIEVLDIVVVGIPLAQTIGRIGNLLNNELWGKNGEPLFAYEGILNLILFGILWKLSKKQRRSGILLGIYLAGYGIIRAVLENFRPSESIWKVSGVPMATIFSVVAILWGGFLIFRRRQV